MLSLNRAEIIGHMTRDPELRTTPSGKSVTSFSVATNQRWTDASGEKQESVEFHDITAWGKLAEIVSTYFKKGQLVYVDGRLQTRSWEAQDGGKRTKTEIIAQNAINLTPRSGVVSGDASESQEVQPSSKEPIKKEKVKVPPDGEGEINIDDIPF